VRSIVRFVVALGVAASGLVASPALAQNLDVGAAYQFLHAPEVNYPGGFNVDASLGLSDNFRVVGEYGIARRGGETFGVEGTLTATNYGGGLRIASDTPGWAPYVQIIAGAHEDKINGFSLTTFMLQPGAGITFPLGSSLGIFGQADYRRIFYDDEAGAENDYRFLAGLRFSRR